MDDTQAGRRKRLVEFKNTLNIKGVAFAKRLKTNPGFLSQLLNGHRNITESFAYQISKCYPNFNPDWLITGDGEMFLLKNEGVVSAVSEPGGGEYEALKGLASRLIRHEAGDKESLHGLAALVGEYEKEILRLRERLADAERVLLEINRRVTELEGKG